jgi:hypothetical protein
MLASHILSWVVLNDASLDLKHGEIVNLIIARVARLPS